MTEFTADNIEGTTWQVTDGTQAWTVAVRADENTPAAAMAAVAEMLAPPANAQAAQAASERAAAARAECRRRILEVVPETAQVNLTAAAAADLLPPADLMLFKAGLGWIAAMRNAWPAMAADNGTGAWPPVPPDVAELARRF